MSAADSATKDSHEKRKERKKEEGKRRRRRRKRRGRGRRRRRRRSQKVSRPKTFLCAPTVSEDNLRLGGMVMTVADIPSCCRFNRLVLIGGYETCHRS